jgi:outer membrane protein assembly factor BamB
MRTLSLMLAVIVTGFLSGCSSAPKNKAAELVPIQPTAQMSVLWQAGIGNAGDFVLTPAVVGDSVYAAAYDGTIARFDNGRQIWRISAGEKLSGGVGADRGLVAVGTAKGDVLTFDAETGRPLWKARISSEVLAAPAISDSLVVVRSGDARIAAFDAKDGKRRWVYQRATPTLTLRSSVGVLLSERVVVAGFPGGKLVAINARNGATLWEVTVAQPKGATELERVADITSLPVVDGKEICAAAFQGRVACFDIASGNQLWAREISSSAGIDMDKTRVYVSDDKGTVHAFSRDSGASLWKQDKLFMRGLSRPIAQGRRVAVADFEGVVHLLNAEDGAFAARVTTDGSAILADPQELGSGFLVQTKKGSLVALGVQ